MFSRRRKNAGFSLIELAIIMAVIGALSVTVLETYRVWYNERIKQDTSYSQSNMLKGLNLFLALYNRMPCPADPSKPLSDPLAGQEVCNVPANSCVGAVCSVTGYRDLNPVDGSNDQVLIGSIPFSAMGLSAKDDSDGWGKRMTYAVTKSLTGTSYDDHNGVIRMKKGARDSAGNLAIGQTSLPGVGFNAFPFVVVSHGPDGKGAYNSDGKLATPCTGLGNDIENCNGDAIFLEASHATDIYSSRPGAEFFDDAYLVYTVSRDGDKWAYDGTDAMTNKTGQKVGISNSAPVYTVDVGGQIELRNYQASEFCSLPSGSKPSYCFTADLIGGVGVSCRTGANDSVLTGLDSTNPVCVNAIATSVISTVSGKYECPGGQFMTGLNALGEVLCAVPPP